MTADVAVLAIDLGGTSMKGAVVAMDGRAVHRESVATPPEGGNSVIAALGDLLVLLAGRTRGFGLRPVAAGVASPGIIEEATGSIEYASNLRWRNVPLARLLHERVGIPVAVGHDVAAAALAEQLLGGAVGVRDFVHVAIGTGVAAGIYDAGSAVLGATRSTGEIGHIPVIPDGELCTCGQRGCLEVYMSGAGLARRYLARAGVPLNAEQIVGKLGFDTVADAVWADATRALSLGLATITLLLDPELVVLGGGVSRAGAALTGPVRTTIDELLAWRDAPRIAVSALGSDAGRVGASALAFRAAGMPEVVDGWRREVVVPALPVDSGALPSAPVNSSAGSAADS
ncbi:ROK family protein [Humibacter antri]